MIRMGYSRWHSVRKNKFGEEGCNMITIDIKDNNKEVIGNASFKLKFKVSPKK